MNDEMTVNVLSVESGVTQYKYASFTPLEHDCHSPVLSVIHENGDFDSTFEYFSVLDGNTNSALAASCGSTFSCNTFSTCLNEAALPTSMIAVNESYNLTISAPSDVHNFCVYSLNINLTVKCMNNPNITTTLEPTPFPRYVFKLCFYFIRKKSRWQRERLE
jgi:hypothetical protein